MHLDQRCSSAVNPELKKSGSFPLTQISRRIIEETTSLAIQIASSEDSDQTAHAQSDHNLRWAYCVMNSCLITI